MRDYLICLSKDDLTFPVKFFEYIRKTQEVEIVEMIDDLVSLASNCICACDDTDMYEKARNILDSILEDEKGTSTVCNLLDELERELDCTKFLSKYGVKTTLKLLRKNKNDPDTTRSLLTQMARSLNKK